MLLKKGRPISKKDSLAIQVKKTLFSQKGPHPWPQHKRAPALQLLVDKIPKGDSALSTDDSSFRCEMSVIACMIASPPSYTRWSVKEAGYEEEVRKAWGCERLTGQGTNVPKTQGMGDMCLE